MINDRTTVAVVGGGNLTFRAGDKVVFSYSSTEFLEGIKRISPADASVLTVANIIKENARAVMNGLSPYVVSGSLNKENAPGGNIVDYIVVGYEDDVPTILKISIEPDWDHRQLTGPFIRTMHTSPTAPINVGIQIFGVNQAIHNAASPDSAEHRVAGEKYPGVIAAFKKDVALNSTEGILIAADLIRLQSEFDSKEVGPPINVVVLHRTERPMVQTIAK